MQDLDSIVDFSKVTILYVEDEQKLRENIADMLSDDVKKVYLATNGDLGLELFNKHDDIDLVISDIQMPQMSGLEMAQNIKALNPNMPIIFTTAFTDARYLMRTIEIGADKYVKKPIDINALFRAIEEVCVPVHQRRQIIQMNETLELKVKEKTLELQELNEHLQERVEIEVAKNRKKDRILIQQSRFSEMGEMIENIAHQWRQPLNTISLLITNIKFKKELGTSSDDDFEKAFSEIEHLVSYLSQTINDFRSFFQPDREVQKFNLEDAISRSLSLTEASFKYNKINVHTKFEAIKIETRGFPNELSQVFLNILNNARDALIEQKLNERNILFCLRQKDENIIIEISDNAGGIDKSTINKIFDPYFTTKTSSKGTGLGLSMCKDIIENHMHGKLNATNSHFKIGNRAYYGAVFTIELPLVHQE